eukprot:2535648-Rhodomonas_salina.1
MCIRDSPPSLPPLPDKERRPSTTSQVSAYARATRRPVLTFRTARTTSVLATRCLIGSDRPSSAGRRRPRAKRAEGKTSYLPTRCPVLTYRTHLP